MKSARVAQYLADVKNRLWWRGLADPRTFEEIETHLYESVEDGLKQGLNLDDAQSLALKRFGSPAQVARLFENERLAALQNIFLAISVLGGIFFATIDSLPKFDDTGVLAFGLLFFCGLIGLIGARKPWLIGLAVGLWIPLHDIFTSGNTGALLALAFALAGAYAGWGINHLIRRSFRTV